MRVFPEAVLPNEQPTIEKFIYGQFLRTKPNVGTLVTIKVSLVFVFAGPSFSILLAPGDGPIKVDTLAIPIPLQKDTNQVFVRTSDDYLRHWLTQSPKLGEQSSRGALNPAAVNKLMH